MHSTNTTMRQRDDEKLLCEEPYKPLIRDSVVFSSPLQLLMSGHTPESLAQQGYPIWLWLKHHGSFGADALQSLLLEPIPGQSLDGFISFLKTKVVAERRSCLCVNPRYVTKSKLNLVCFSHNQQLPGLHRQRPGRIVIRLPALHQSPLCSCGGCGTRARS